MNTCLTIVIYMKFIVICLKFITIFWTLFQGHTNIYNLGFGREPLQWNRKWLFLCWENLDYCLFWVSCNKTFKFSRFLLFFIFLRLSLFFEEFRPDDLWWPGWKKLIIWLLKDMSIQLPVGMYRISWVLFFMQGYVNCYWDPWRKWHFKAY